MAGRETRRRILQWGSVVTLGTLAGCSTLKGTPTERDEDEDSDADPTDTSTDTPTDTPRDTPTDTPDPEREGGTLDVAIPDPPIEFDPIVVDEAASMMVSGRIFEGLYAYDERVVHVAELARSLPKVSADGTTYEVALDPDARFQSGDRVRAEDVRYSLLAPLRESTQNASRFNMIDRVEVVDDLTVEIHLKYPYAPFLHSLHLGIVPKSVREKDKRRFSRKRPVGSGPFRFEDRLVGSYVRLRGWDDYWDEPVPHLDAVAFHPVSSAKTRLSTLTDGTNDVMQGIPPKLLGTVESTDGVRAESAPQLSYFYLAFNCKEGPTTSRRVREAVDYCFSMDRAVNEAVEPAGTRMYSPLPDPVAKTWDMPLAEWKTVPHDENISNARALFEEADVPMDYSWRIIVPPDDRRELIAIIVANGLKEAGFENVTVQRLDWSDFLQRYVTGDAEDYNMYVLGWGAPDTPDPDSFTYPLLSRSEAALGVTNGCFWGANSEGGKEAARKFVRARKTADWQQRQRLYEEGITMALEARAHLPAYNLQDSWALRDAVNQFDAHSADHLHLSTECNNAWLETKE